MLESRTSIKPVRGMRCRDCIHGDKKISFATRGLKEDGSGEPELGLIGQMMPCLGPSLLRFFSSSEMLIAPRVGDTCINPGEFRIKTLDLRRP